MTSFLHRHRPSKSSSSTYRERRSLLRKALRAETLEPRVMLFNPFTHIEAASDVRSEVIDDGQITIEGKDYPVHPRIVEALERFPSHFYGGAVGPDGYPDLIMGQQVVHTEAINIWTSHVLDKAWEVQRAGKFDAQGYTETEKLQVLAWSYGYASHAIGDLWVHTFVDEVADGPFPGVVRALDVTNDFSRSNALKHIIIESYIADATPGFDGVGKDETGEAQEQLPNGDVSSNSSTTRELNGPHRFIHDTLLYDLPNLVGQNETLLFEVIPKDSEQLIRELNDFSFVGVFSTEELNRNGVHFTGELRRERPSFEDLDPGGEDDLWVLQADYREFVVRKAEDGSLSFSEVDHSRGLIVDQFLTLRQQLVNLMATLPPPAGGIAEPLQGLVEETETAILRMVNGDGFDFVAGAGNIIQIADQLIDPFREVMSDIANGRPVTREALLNMATQLGELGGGTAAGYLQYWINNIDEGLQNWSVAGQSLARSMFDPQARRDVQNAQGATSGADAVGLDYSDEREDAEKSSSLFRTLIGQLEDPNSDGDEADSYVNNHLVSMLGAPKIVGRVKALLQRYVGQIERDLLDPLDQLPRDINPLSPALDLLKDKIKEFAVDIIKKAVEERFGVDIDTVSGLLNDGSARLDIRSVTLSLPGSDEEFVTPLFRPTDHELLDRAMGFYGTDHLVPLENGGGELLEPFGEVIGIELFEDAHGRLEDNAEFDKATFAPYANTVTMTNLLLLQEWDPMLLDDFNPGPPDSPSEKQDHPRTISRLLSDLTGAPYDFSLLNDLGNHGGSLFAATLPGVRNRFGNLVADSENYRQPFDHDVWFRSMDGDHMWREDSAFRLADLYRVISTKSGSLNDSMQEPTVHGYVEYRLDSLVAERTYRIQTDWLLNNQLHDHGHNPPATTATYQVLVDGEIVETVTVNQSTSPGDTSVEALDEIVFPRDDSFGNTFEAYGQSWRHLAELSVPEGAVDYDVRVRVLQQDANGEFVVAGRVRVVDKNDPNVSYVIDNRDHRYVERPAALFTYPTGDPAYVESLRRMEPQGVLPAALLDDLREHGQLFGDEYYRTLDPEQPEDVYSRFFTADSSWRKGYILNELPADDGQRLFELVRLVDVDPDTNGIVALGDRYHLLVQFTGATSATISLTQPWRDIHYQTGVGDWAVWESEQLRDPVFRRLFHDWQNGDVVGNWLTGETTHNEYSVESMFADLSGSAPTIRLAEEPLGEDLARIVVTNSAGEIITISRYLGEGIVELDAESVTDPTQVLHVTYPVENNFPNFGDSPSQDPNDGSATIDFMPFAPYEPELPFVTEFSSGPGVSLVVTGSQALHFEDDTEISSIVGDDTGGFDNVTVTVDGKLTLAGFAGAGGLRDITFIAQEIVIADGAVISSRQLPNSAFDHFSDIENANSGDITLIAPKISIGEEANLLAHAFERLPGDIRLIAESDEEDSNNHIVAALLDNLVGSGLEYEEAIGQISVGNSANLRGAEVTLSVESAINRELVLEEQPFAYRTTDSVAVNLDDDPETEWIVATQGSGIYVFDYDAEEDFFRSATQIESGVMNFSSLAVVDANSDGRLDLVAGSEDSLDRLYINAGGSLVFDRELGTEIRTTTVVATASNEDTGGSARVIVGTAGEGVYYYDLSTGTETLIDADATNSLDAADISVGDVNGDGALDFVLANARGVDRFYAANSGNYTGTDLELPAGTLGQSSATVLANLDSDPQLELVVATNREGVHLYQGSSTGLGSPTTLDTAALRTTDISVADINGDGRQDLLLANDHQSDQFWLGEADGTFDRRILNPQELATTSISAVDLNGDAQLDVLITADRAPSRFYLQDEFDGDILFPLDTYVGVDRSIIDAASSPLPISTGDDSEESGVGLLGGDEAIVVSADANATISIGEGAWIESADDLTLLTNAQATATVRSSESAFGITFGRTRPTSKVTVLGGARLDSGGSVILDADATSDLDVLTSVPTVGETTGFSVSLAINDAESKIDVRSGVSITSSGLIAQSENNVEYSNTATASSFGTAEDRNTVFAAVLATGFNQSTATTLLGGIVEVDGDASVDATAHMNKNITRSYGWVSGGSSVSDEEERENSSADDSGFADIMRRIMTVLPLTPELEDLGEGVAEGTDMIEGYATGTGFQLGNSEFSSSTPGNQIAASFALANTDNDAAASIDTEAIFRVNGSLSVTAHAEDQFQISATSTAGLVDPGDNLSLGGAVAYSTTANQSSAFLGWNTRVDAREAITVNATSVRTSPVELLPLVLAVSGAGESTQIAGLNAAEGYADSLIGSEDADEETNVQNAINNGLDSIFGEGRDAVLSEEKVGNSFVSSTASTEDGVGLSFALNFTGTYNAAYAGVAEGAWVNQNAASLWDDGGTSDQDLTVTALATSDNVNIAGTNSVLNVVQDDSKTTGGGVIDVTMNQNRAIASVGDRTQVDAVNVTVDADANLLSTLVALAGGQADKTAVEGAAAFNQAKNLALALVEDRAQLSVRNDLVIDATTDSDVITITPGVAVSGVNSVGIGAAINYLVDRSEAYIADRHSDLQGMCRILEDGSECGRLTGGRRTYGGDEERHIPAGGYMGAVEEMPLEIPLGTELLGRIDVGGNVVLRATSQPNAWNVAIAAAISTGSDSGSGASGPQSSLEVSDTENDMGSSGGDGGLGIAASFGLNLVRTATAAYIDDASTLVADGSVAIDADSDANVITVAGSLSVAVDGGAGAGNYAQNHFLQYTKASVDRAHVRASTLDVHATSSDRQLVIAPTASVASDRAGAAGIALATTRINTTASLGEQARVDAMEIDVVSDNRMDLIPVVGLISVGGDGAYGANLAVTNVDAFVHAWVDDTAEVVGDSIGNANLRVVANNATDLTAVAAAVAVSGESAAAGSGNWIDLDHDVQARVDGSATVDANPLIVGNLYLDADDDTFTRAIAGTVGAGSDNSVGISLSHLSIDRTLVAAISPGAVVHASGNNDPLRGPDGIPTGANGIGVTLDATAMDRQLVFAAAGAASGGISVSPSIVINRGDSKVLAVIEPGAQVNTIDDNAGSAAAQSVHLNALHLSSIVDVAGSIAVGSDAGIGVALDLLFLNKETVAEIDSSATVNALGSVRTYAGVEPGGEAPESIVSVVAGLGAAGTAGVAASVSVLTVEPITRAGVTTLTSAPDGAIHAGGAIDIRAYSALDANFVSGSGAVGSTAGVGAANATLRKTSATSASIGEQAVVSANEDISANAFQNDSVVSVGAALGAAGTAGVAGVAVVTLLNNEVKAQIHDNAAVRSHSGSVELEALDHTQTITVAGSLGVGGTVGAAAGADVSKITKTTEASIGSSVLVDADENVLVIAESMQDITSVAAGLAAAGTAAVALDASVHVIDLTTRAWIGEDPASPVLGAPSQVVAMGSVIVDANDRNEIDKVTGALAAAGLAGIAGAGGVSIINKQVESFVGEGTRVSALGLRDAVIASTGTYQTIFEGGIQKDVKDESIGVEANNNKNPEDFVAEDLAQQGEVPLPMLADMDLDQSGPETEESDLEEQALRTQRIAKREQEFQKGLVVTATQNDDIEVYTMSAGFGLVGVAISASANVIENNVAAYIGDYALVNPQDAALPPAGPEQSVLVSAASDFYHMAIAGSLAAGLAAVSPAIATSHIQNQTAAFVGSNARVTAENDITVQADSEDKVVLVGISVSGGLVGIAGASSILSFDEITHAYIGSEAHVVAGDTVAVDSASETNITTVTGALAGGLVSVGASVGVITVNKDTQSILGAAPGADGTFEGEGAHIVGRGEGDGHVNVLTGGRDDDERFRTATVSGVIVQAESYEDLTHIVAVAGGGFVAVSGAIALTFMDADVTASIHNGSDVNGSADRPLTRGNVFVNAASRTDINIYSLGFAGGFVSLAGAVDVGSVRNEVTATIGSNAVVVAAKDVEVNALQKQELDSLVFSGSGGVAALAAGVSVWTLGSPLEGDLPTDEEGTTATEARTYDVLEEDPQGDAADSAQNGRDALLGSVDLSRDGDESKPTRTNQGLSGFMPSSEEERADNSAEVAETTGEASARIADRVPDKLEILAEYAEPFVPRGAQAIIGAEALIEAGDDIHVHAFSIAQANIRVGAAAAGVVGVGGSFSVVKFNNNAEVIVAGSLVAGDDLSIQAQQVDDAQSFTRGYAGGLGALAGSRSSLELGGTTSITIAPASELRAETIVLDAEHVYQPRSFIDNVTGGAVAGLGAKAIRTLHGGANIDVGDDSQIHAERLRIQTHNEVEKHSAESGYDLKSRAGGIGAFALLASSTEIGSEDHALISHVSVGEGTEILVESQPSAAIGSSTTSLPFTSLRTFDLFPAEDQLNVAPASLEILATSNIEARDGASGRTGGLAESTQVNSTIIAHTSGQIRLDGARVSNASGDVSLISDSDSQISAAADTQVVTVISLLSSATSEAIHRATNNIVVVDSEVRGEDLQLFAGRGRDRLPSRLGTLAIADLSAATPLPFIQPARAVSQISESNTVRVGGSSRLIAFEDVNLAAEGHFGGRTRTATSGETSTIFVLPVVADTEDTVASAVTISNSAKVTAGATSEAKIRVLPLPFPPDLPGDASLGDRLSVEQKQFLGLNEEIDYEFAALGLDLGTLQLRPGAIVQVDVGHLAGGTVGNFYELLPEDDEAFVELNLVEEDFSVGARWRDLGAAEPVDAIVLGSGDRQRIESLVSDYYALKPVDADPVLVQVTNAALLLVKQRDQLLDWIESYAGDTETVARYSIQLEEVERRLTELGVGEVTETGATLYPSNLDLPLLSVPKLTASPGSVFIEAAQTRRDFESLLGEALTAHSGAEIDLRNESPFSLVVDDLKVEDNVRLLLVDGEVSAFTPGNVYLNKVPLTDASASATGRIDVFQSTLDDDRLSELGFADLPQDMYIVGSIVNDEGDISIHNVEGSIHVSGEIRGGGEDSEVKIDANGDFSLNSDFLDHTGEDPRSLLNGDELTLLLRYLNPKLDLGTSRPETVPLPPLAETWNDLGFIGPLSSTDPSIGIDLAEALTSDQSSVVANGRINITARYLNVNGLLQSGVDTVGLTFTPEFDASAATNGFFDEDNNLLPGITVNPIGSKLVTGYFDQDSDSIVLDDIVTRSGSIHIAGQILSTGNGRLVVANGFANVDIDNQTDWTLEVGEIDVSADRVGEIRVTDTELLRQQRYRMSEGGIEVRTFKVNVDDGLTYTEQGDPASLSNPAIYQVGDGTAAQTPFYSWSLGTETASETFYQYEQRKFLGVDALARDQSSPTVVEEVFSFDKPLLYPETIESRAQIGLATEDQFLAKFRQSLNDTVQLIRDETLVFYAESGDPAEGTWYQYIGASIVEEQDLQLEDFDSSRWRRVIADVINEQDDLTYTEVLGPRSTPGGEQTRNIAGYRVQTRSEKVGWGLRRKVTTDLVQSASTANYYTFALSAAQGIGIQFLPGADEPTIALDSRGGIRLASALSVPDGIGGVELNSSHGSIEQSDVGGIFGAIPEVTALRGDVDFNLASSISSTSAGDTELNILAGGDIFVTAFALSPTEPGVLAIGQVISTDGNVVLFGPDGIDASSDMSLIAGKRVELYSSRGGIGVGDKKPDLRIDTQRTDGGGLAAYAEGSIRLVEIAESGTTSDFLESEIQGDLLLVLPQSLPASLGTTASVTSRSGNVELIALGGDILDGQREFFHGRFVAMDEDLSISQRNSMNSLQVAGMPDDLFPDDPDPDQPRFNLDSFRYPISPALYRSVLPEGPWIPGATLATEATEQPNIIGESISLSAAGSIGQLTEPTVLDYPFEAPTDLKESDRYTLSVADPEHVLGVRYELLQYVGVDAEIDLLEADFENETLWRTIEADFRTPSSSAAVVTIQPGHLVAVEGSAENYGLYRYLGEEANLNLSEQIYQDVALWELVEADVRSSDGKVDVQTNALVLNEQRIRAMTLQLNDDVDVHASHQLQANADLDITIASPVDLPISSVITTGDVWLATEGSLIDLGDNRLSVFAAGDVQLESVGDILGIGEAGFGVQLPAGWLSVNAGGAATIQQVAEDIAYRGTTYSVDDLSLDRAQSTGPLAIEVDGGDLIVRRAFSEAEVTLTATGAILDAHTVAHDSYPNVLTVTNTASESGNVNLDSGAAIGSLMPLVLSLPDGELTVLAEGSIELLSVDDLLARSVESTEQDVTLTVDGRLLVGAIAAPGRVELIAEHDIVDTNHFEAFDVQGSQIELKSLQGSVGEYLNDLEVDRIADDDGGPGDLRADAEVNVFVLGVNGELRLGPVNAAQGDVRIGTRDTEADHEDLILPPLAGINAPSGTVRLQAGDDIDLSSIIKADRIFIVGDYRNADMAGTTIQIDGSLIAASVEIRGHNDDDFFTMTGLTTPVVVRMLGGDDSIKGGRGDDFIDGGAGADFIEGGEGNDRLLAGLGVGDRLFGGPGDDVLIGSDEGSDQDENFEDTLRFGDLLDGGPGNDRIAGLGGADLIFGGPGDDHIDSGAAVDRVLAGDGDDWIYPGLEADESIDGGSGANTILGPGAAPDLAKHTLPDGPIDSGRWLELRGSASESGVSGPANPDAISHSTQPSLAIINNTRYLAWTETRNGRSQVYVAFSSGGSQWQPLGQNELGGGVSDSSVHSSEPSLIVDESGQLLMAWTERKDGLSDVLVARYDASEQKWEPLAGSGDGTGVSQTKAASQAQLVDHIDGPVVAWLDHSGDVPQIFVRQYDGSAWKAIGLNEAGEPSDQGGGLSLAPTGHTIRDLQLASDGQHLAAVWTLQDADGNSSVHLREFDGEAWKEIYGSASGTGLSGLFDSAVGERTYHQSPTLTFSSNRLFVAWQAFSDQGAQVVSLVVQQTDGVWQPPVPMGELSAAESDARPQLFSGGGEVGIAWQPDTQSLYVARLMDDGFEEQVPGDASGAGIHGNTEPIQQPAVASNADGELTIAWVRADRSGASVLLRTEALGFSWTNALDPFDVNGDGTVSPIDALIVINDLNLNGGRELPDLMEAPFAWLDTSGDGFLSSIDALLVINYLNRGGGEAENTTPSDMAFDTEMESPSVWFDWDEARKRRRTNT